MRNGIKILISIFFCVTSLCVQGQVNEKKNWQHLDLQNDGVFGISTDRAYKELLTGKKPVSVIVGIVDAGVDTLQEDLKSVIWSDPKTGHHGWNFIGPETGREDIAMLANDNRQLYDSLEYTTVPEKYREGYRKHRYFSKQLGYKRDDMASLVAELERIDAKIKVILKKMGTANPTVVNFQQYNAPKPTADDTSAWKINHIPAEGFLVKAIARRLSLYPDWQSCYYNEVTHLLALATYHLNHGLNIDNLEADTAGGNFDIAPDKLGPVSSPNFTPYHGTHVAGIIGAVRGNGIGMDGVADDVQILMLKENGNLREMRDEALARAIRFAVDHGAKVINMSFGKPYTWNKKVVDDAVRYAMKKDVLLVHAAGNDGNNIDEETHYPNPVFLDKTKANNWLEVGASGFKNDSTLYAKFSNYGKRDVDVFAPGVAIYSTLPFNQYVSWPGTSMAAPMVAGLAALIREYYPKLTAAEVRDIIMKTVVKSTYLKEKCASGGVVNAYNALKMAATCK